MKKMILGFLLAGCMGPLGFSQVVVRQAPPLPVVEQPGLPPSEGFVWEGGYHRWDGGRYVWVPGQWEKPPRPHAHWVRHRWRRKGNGWVMVEGHWR